MVVAVAICLMTSSIMAFFPIKETGVCRILMFLSFCIFGCMYLFVFRKDKLWLCLIAGMKICILNVYELSLWLLESENERIQEHDRRMNLYYKSCGIDFLLLLGICA